MIRFYERLYVGERAKKRRADVIRAVRAGKRTGYWILTPPSNGRNLLDIYPAFTLSQPYYKEKELLVLGVAADFEDAAKLSARIINQVYKKTGGFDVTGFLLETVRDETEKSR